MTKFPIVEPKISNYLACLSKEEIKEVIELFHQKELTIAQIIDKFNLETIFTGSFVKQLPPSHHYELVCPVCKVVSWIDQKSRGNTSKPYCPICKETLIHDYDPKERLRKLEQERRAEEYFKKMDPNHYDFELYISSEKYRAFSFGCKVFLGTIVAIAIEDDMKTVKGKELRNKKVVPNGIDLFQVLLELGVSAIEDYTDYLYRIHRDVVLDLLNCKTFLDSSLEERLIYWRELAINEAREYLISEMEQFGFRFKQENKFKEVFTKLIEKFSVSQIHYLIYVSVREACNLYTMSENKFMAANSIVGGCLRFQNYLTSNERPIKSYHRSSKCPQSLLSKYFFNNLIKIGDKGFYNVPSFDLLT